MPLKDASAPIKRDFYMQAIKNVVAEMETDLSNWDYFFIDVKARKMQADFEKFEAKIMSIICDEAADEDMRMESDGKLKEISKIHFSSMATLRKRKALLSSEASTIKLRTPRKC